MTVSRVHSLSETSSWDSRRLHRDRGGEPSRPIGWFSIVVHLKNMDLSNVFYTFLLLVIRNKKSAEILYKDLKVGFTIRLHYKVKS